MNWIGTLLLATSLTTSLFPASYTDAPTNEQLLIKVLGYEATKAIAEKYQDDRSWYPPRFKILSIEKSPKNSFQYVVMEIPSCTITDLYTPGVEHDDIVTLAISISGYIRVVKIEQLY